MPLPRFSCRNDCRLSEKSRMATNSQGEQVTGSESHSAEGLNSKRHPSPCVRLTPRPRVGQLPGRLFRPCCMTWRYVCAECRRELPTRRSLIRHTRACPRAGRDSNSPHRSNAGEPIASPRPLRFGRPQPMASRRNVARMTFRLLELTARQQSSDADESARSDPPTEARPPPAMLGRCYLDLPVRLTERQALAFARPSALDSDLPLRPRPLLVRLDPLPADETTQL